MLGRWGIILAIAIGFASGGIIWLNSSRKVARVPGSVAFAKPAVELSVRPEQSGVRLSWDPQSELLRAATRGTLSIEDGAHQSRLELDRRELNAGSMFYQPETSEVRFRLEANAGNHTSTGEIQVPAGFIKLAEASVKTDSQAPSPAEPPKREAHTPHRPLTPKHALRHVAPSKPPSGATASLKTSAPRPGRVSRLRTWLRNRFRAK